MSLLILINTTMYILIYTVFLRIKNIKFSISRNDPIIWDKKKLEINYFKSRHWQPEVLEKLKSFQQFNTAVDVLHSFGRGVIRTKNTEVWGVNRVKGKIYYKLFSLGGSNYQLVPTYKYLNLHFRLNECSLTLLSIN